MKRHSMSLEFHSISYAYCNADSKVRSHLTHLRFGKILLACDLSHLHHTITDKRENLAFHYIALCACIAYKELLLRLLELFCRHYVACLVTETQSTDTEIDIDTVT